MAYCRCCYSADTLKMLSDPELHLYKLICGLQRSKNDDSSIGACLRCHEFLQEVHRFRIGHNGSGGIHFVDQNVKSHEIELALTNIKTEVKHEESPENVSNKSETALQSFLVSNIVKTDNQIQQEIQPKTIDRCDKTEQIWEIKIDSEGLKREHERSDYSLISSNENNNNQFQNSMVSTDDTEFNAPSLQILSCKLCSFSTSVKFNMKRHMIKHTNDRLYACDHCNYRAKTKTRIIQHIRMHSKKHNKPYKCTQCSYESLFPADLKRHTRRLHNDVKPFSCDQCNYSTTTNRHLSIHKREHLNDCDHFKCGECSYKTTIMSNLKRHNTSKHSDEWPFSCDKCDYRGKFKFKLIQHMMNHSNGPNKSFKCTECSYESSTHYGLKEHILRKHTDEKPFECDQCDFRAKLKKQIISHKKIHSSDNDNPFKCTECSYETPILFHLKRHTMRKHSDERPLCCDHCDYRCKFKFELVRHMVNHFGDVYKPYKCTECSHRSFTRYAMREHISHKHTDVKPFSCEQCNYCASTKKNLIVHKRIHLTGSDNPFRCNECSYKTTNMSNLKRHTVVKHSDEKPFSCDQCDFCARSRQQMETHRKSHLKTEGTDATN